MTRRSAILIGLGLPGLAAIPARAFSPKEFWDEKQPADWTKDEVQELLTKSPWARDAIVSYNSGPGNVGRTGMTRRGSVVNVPGGGIPSGGTSVGQERFKAIVRWETALPIRLASHSKSTDDPAANYILNLIGDVPMLGAHRDEDGNQVEQRTEMLKEYTRLDRKHDPIFLGKVVFPSPAETLFYFPRLDPIFPDDRTVTFTTKLGPIEVKARFTLKEMTYQGKLEL
jgi:hypothetical protein